MYFTNHTIRLQDGSLFNFKRRIKKRWKSLLQILDEVKDGRQNQGKRYELSSILFLLFSGITVGETTIKGCCLWAVHNQSFLRKYGVVSDTIPNETTVSRAMGVCDVESLITAFNRWRDGIFGLVKDRVASIDGKSIRAIHGNTIGGHIVSLFTHDSHQTLFQVTVVGKSNEIPALQEMVSQAAIGGLTLVADALHAQTKTAALIRENQAHYFLFVKGNQEELMRDIALTLSDPQLVIDTASSEEQTSSRTITTEVTLTHDIAVMQYCAPQWKDSAAVGRIHRSGTRTRQGVATKIEETVLFISSRSDLTASQAATIARCHWSIENNLHWQKDYTFFEDRHRLRRGNAPSVMTFLRSCCIGLYHLFSFSSVTQVIANFKHNAKLHHTFLQSASLV